MSQKENPLTLVAALLVTMGILGGGLWFLGNRSPGFLEEIFGNDPSSKDSPTKSTRNLEQGNITLLGDTFSGYSTFRNAEFQEALQEVGITLSYGNEFDQTARANLLNEGKADLYVTTLDQFLKQNPEGKIVGLIDRTIGADAVVLNNKQYPDLNSLNSLQTLQQSAQGESLSITYAVDTPSEYLALVLSTAFDGFNLSDFDVKEVVDASEAWQALQNPAENVAVAVLWEPFVSQARNAGYTVVLSSNDAPTAILDVIVASDRLLTARPDLVSDFLEAYYRHIDANIREPSQLRAQIATDGELTPSEADSILEGIDFFTSIEAKNWIQAGTLEQRIGSTAAVLVLSGKLNQVPTDINSLFTDEYVNKAALNTQTLIDLIKVDNPELADRLAGKGTTIQAVPQVAASEVAQASDIGNLQVRGEVNFATGSATLSQQSQTTLEQLVNQIKEFNPQTVGIRVIGHTSKTGDPKLNQTLSQQRAQVVVDGLRQRGLQHNIIAEGKGFYLPLSGIAPEDPKQQRTEIRLVRLN
ncbi:OmpA/MotB domain protein [[Leptolyngbya] sp. PCC 7376]|uniref:OmpA family protein n=1 Tax=[Leptolyngbya] sp. PCC 7376 TaxID=111781 RepID=UPI00029F3DD7|nr:phosphate ABC transporter substrate-binding/OmpA family protein [[Leptolyngbya] sp. PCC 7376]AFY38623.1 OmpA/MotB domain protein [[Leptolyngbya] sp. PCC 7376]